jgi:hypothetical protein
MRLPADGLSVPGKQIGGQTLPILSPHEGGDKMVRDRSLDGVDAYGIRRGHFVNLSICHDI